jgi:Na+/proline symporter
LNLDAAIVLAFVVAALAGGIRASRRASRGLEEYFLAGRRLRGWEAGLSMAATQYAADTPLLATGLVATGGVFLLWRFWIYGFGYLLIALVFAECWRRARVITDAELTELRYGGAGVLTLRTLKALYFGTVVNGVFLAMVLLAGIRIAEVFLPWHLWLPESVYQVVGRGVQVLGLEVLSAAGHLSPEVAATNAFLSLALILGFVVLYSTLGGLRGVVTTDVLQFTFIMVGTFAYAVLVVREVGGFSGLRQGLLDAYGRIGASEFLGILPRGGSTVLLPFLAVIGLQGLFWVGSDGTGYLAQRAMGCENDEEARKAGVLFTWVQILLRSMLWLLIGVSLLVLYPFASHDAGMEGFAAAREMTFVHGIRDLFPPGLKGVMLAGLLAALASTIDTHLNWGASYWTRDLYERVLCQEVLSRRPSGRELVWVARASNIVILGLALLVMGRVGSIQGAWFVSLLFGAGIGGVLMLRWMWSRITLWSEVGALGVSLVGAPLLLLTVQEEWLRLSLMVLASNGVAILLAWMGPGNDPKVLEEFERRVCPPGWWTRGEGPGEGEAQPSGPGLLWARLRIVALMAGSLFLLLLGLVRVLLPLPGGGFAWSWLALLVGGMLVPIWWGSWRMGSPRVHSD